MGSKIRHPLIHTLRTLKGNPRACVYTEPLWGIPHTLYTPYMALYMRALGMSDAQVGLIATITTLIQVVFALLSGPITDKLGRKKATLIFDIISWSIPAVIWAVAQNFYFFLAAGAINAIFRITYTSWTCLLVEDADHEKMTHIWTWIFIAGLISGLFAPIAGLLVGKFSLVPTIRVLFWITFVMMTAKFIILYFMSTETENGKLRMMETKDKSILHLLGGYFSVITKMFKNKKTVIALSLKICFMAYLIIKTNYWGIHATERLGLPESMVAISPFILSGIMLAFYFFITPKISPTAYKRPLMTGLILILISQIVLIFAPVGSLVILIISILLDACGLSLTNPTIESLVVISIDKVERARIMSVMDMTAMAFIAPFGWIAGLLSEINKAYPFVLAFFVLMIGLLLLIYSNKKGLIET